MTNTGNKIDCNNCNYMCNSKLLKNKEEGKYESRNYNYSIYKRFKSRWEQTLVEEERLQENGQLYMYK